MSKLDEELNRMVTNQQWAVEVDFHQSLQEGKLSKDQKVQKRLYEKRWKGQK
jgi:hypothetical protein